MNLGLAHRILEAGGLLISPFPPMTEPARWNFPIRNQFIAALADATLVASAAKKSGALITARLAIEYGKDVFVIPGSVEDALYEGSNLLLQQGAHPILSANDLLEYFDFSPAAQKEYITDDPGLSRIIGLLKQRRCTVNELTRELKLTGSEAGSLITKLELKGWIAIGTDGTIALT
jgi:DNA processing protein